MVTLVFFHTRQIGSFAASVGGFANKPSFTTPFRGGSRHVNSLARSLSNATKKSVRVKQVIIVHRHGDRTPITPLRNETYWESTLPSEALLHKLSAQTRLIRDESKPNTHKAGGRGPFGKLTQLGLLQMVELGTQLREELHCVEKGHARDDKGNVYQHHGRLFHSEMPLAPENIQVISTDFPRTIQSVQGVLIGLFDDDNTTVIDIDARHTSNLIPDPQPRRSKEQEELELKLAAQPHLQEREAEMKDLAVKTTLALSPLLGDGAFDVSFGVGEEKTKTSHHHHLAWTQLSEITKCLQVRNMLPPSITAQDQEAISSHAAWKWMECLRNPRLAYLAMNPMTSSIVDSMKRILEGDKRVKPLLLYSAHDSTLIGLLCAFRLEQPSKWPEYGAWLKIELIECCGIDSDDETSDKEHFVRFSLSGNVLKSQWDPKDDPVEVISLTELAEKVTTEGSQTHHSKHHLSS
jgi:acid phosphatase